jgi:hypothetical protein
MQKRKINGKAVANFAVADICSPSVVVGELCDFLLPLKRQSVKKN